MVNKILIPFFCIVLGFSQVSNVLANQGGKARIPLELQALDQKELFVYYFSKLISQTYFTQLAGKDVQNVTIQYMENTPLKQKKNMFRTDISTQIAQGEKQLQVIYRMIKKKTLAWKIYDIKVAGVSMAANYREQYRQQVSQTPEAIITELREKVEK